jgi:hypothetical protein
MFRETKLKAERTKEMDIDKYTVMSNKNYAGSFNLFGWIKTITSVHK